MMKILTSKQIYKADIATIKKEPITSLDLMERAAIVCFDKIKSYLIVKERGIHIFCGIGNNGGDGLVIARKLIQEKYPVKTYIVNFGVNRSGDFKANYNRLLEIGHPIIELNDGFKLPKILDNEIIIDAIFGIGLSRTPTGFVKELIVKLNRTKAYIISIDIPSGLFADSTVIDKEAVIIATEVLTFQNPKLAFLLPDNKNYIKNWNVMNIGLHQETINSFESSCYLIDIEDIKSIYRQRNKFSHKGNFGHSLIIGGSFGKIGAVVLATRAALKAGSGLVTAYIPKCGYEIMQTANPEIMVEVDAEDQLEFFNFKTKPTVIGIGMGIGTSDKTCIGFGKFLKENKLPLVIDADGLNIFARHPELLELMPDKTILTPHPKEFERMVGKWENDFEKFNKLIKFSSKFHCIVVLKGAYSAIVNQENIYFNSTGNSALATAGSGDVLTGIITALLAQNYSSLHAAFLGVYIHGLSADFAIKDKHISKESFIASDCINYLGRAFNFI